MKEAVKDQPNCPFCGGNELTSHNQGLHDPFDAILCRKCRALAAVELWAERPREKELERLCRAAYHALRSYLFGNQADELAREIVKAIADKELL